MGDDGDQIDVIVAHRFGDFSSGFTFDNYRLDLQAVKQRIGQQLFDLVTQLLQPVVNWIGQNVGRQRCQVRGDLGVLDAEQNNTAVSLTGKRGCIFQSRPGVWREIRWKENVFE